jgi:hypothetical protein
MADRLFFAALFGVLPYAAPLLLPGWRTWLIVAVAWLAYLLLGTPTCSTGDVGCPWAHTIYSIVVAAAASGLAVRLGQLLLAKAAAPRTRLFVALAGAAVTFPILTLLF